MRKGTLFSRVIILITLVIFAVFTLGPFYFLITASLRPGREVMQKGITVNVDFNEANFNNYAKLVTVDDAKYFLWYLNSCLITAVFTIASLFLSSLVGYGFAKYNFRFKNFFFMLVLAVMMIPVEILILPLFRLIVFLKIINTYAGVILPFVVSPFAAFFFMQYAKEIPGDFMDAARIDGCNDFSIYFRVMVPLMKPAFGAMAILQSMMSWNSFVWPLIALRTDEMFTLPIGLSSMIAPYGDNYDMLFAGAVLAVVPIIIIYLFNQKAFVAGLTGGIKG